MMPAANSRRCVVEIGGIPIALHADDEQFLALLRQRYVGFLSSTPPELELDLDLTSQGPVSDDDVRVRREGPEWLLERGDFHARWNPRTGRARVRQNPNPYALDSVLRILHSLVLAARGGFLLHAASAITSGATGAPARPLLTHREHAQAYLFSGVSGAGKTTISRHAPPDVTLLTDEISYVRPSASGYAAYGTPFAGELAKAGENCSAAVAALFFLEKGPENQVDDLSPSEAVRRLMRNILFFAEDRELVEKLFATACDFVKQVPVRRLTFYPDSRVWDEIRHFEATPAHV
ncbi:MAG: hypothetical protein HY233_07595 [Acidobacteriales bacterium]|nr:hypothetical protein [Candidatus Koribacter versatilis]MBI3645810.1 hypothetical protein [Terriglobales bacterium]